jgi:iron(III) transport system permease protein
MSRTGGSYAASGRAASAPRPIPLAGWRAGLALAWAALVFGLAFALPAAQVLAWAAASWTRDFDARYLDFASHSLLLSALGAALVVALALILGYAQRLRPTAGMRVAARLATLGYALPGAVLAVGIFIPVAWLDNQLIERLGLDGQVLGGTLAAMLLAYCARFLAVSHGPLEAGLARISRSVDEAAQSLGVVGARRLWRVHLPMLRVSLLTAAALTFVDIMKELPITLMTRPFGWDTLAVRVFEMTSEGEWERAALPAAAIVLVGLLPVFLLIRHADHARS